MLTTALMEDLCDRSLQSPEASMKTRAGSATGISVNTSKMTAIFLDKGKKLISKIQISEFNSRNKSKFGICFRGNHQ